MTGEQNVSARWADLVCKTYESAFKNIVQSPGSDRTDKYWLTGPEAEPGDSDGCRCAGLRALLQLSHPYSVKAHWLNAGECECERLLPNKLWCNSLHLARAAPPRRDHGPVRRNRTSRRPGRAPGPVWSGRSAGSESFPSGVAGVPGHARWDRAARRRNS